MAYTLEKDTGDLVITFPGDGIAPSPHRGTANIQNGNISTELGEVMASYGRSQANMTSTSATGSLTFSDSTHVGLSISSSTNKFKGMWIIVSASSHPGELPDGTYYVTFSIGSTYQLSSYYNGAVVTGFTAGLTATISLLRTMTRPVASAIETYTSGASNYYRYYILDSQGLVWVYDTIYDLFPTDDQQYWFLPDSSISYFGSDTAPTGVGVLNGWLHTVSGNKIWVKSTVNLGGTTSASSTWVQMTNALLNSLSNTGNPHFAYTGHQGKMYITDGSYIASIFPNSALQGLSGINIQSFAKYTAVTTTGTISNIVSGSTPWTADAAGATYRIPAVFFTDQAGTRPTNLTVNVVYYISYAPALGTFEVFAAASGGAAINIQTGAVGNQYFNTYFPIGTAAGAYGSTSTTTFTPQRVNLPYGEVAQCMTEVGNNIIIGGIGNVLYPWNQQDPTPSSLITLPESDTKVLITVNQMAYAFVGAKANIYITDGSVASLVVKVPDYCSGIAGTPSSYVEPRFVWGGAMYLRGRVYFSILDQTLIANSSSQEKAGNCGGIWSFVPSQNLYIGQDTGIALRLENQNSYGTYNGVATVLIPWQNQSVKSPQYWSAWYSTLVAPVAYGIDTASTGPVGTTVIETDLMPVGTVLGFQRRTFENIEYKLSAPLASGESVAVSYRQNGTDSYVTAGTVQRESDTSLSGYISPLSFQASQWLQLKITLTPITSPNSSFVRLTEVRLRTRVI